MKQNYVPSLRFSIPLLIFTLLLPSMHAHISWSTVAETATALAQAPLHFARGQKELTPEEQQSLAIKINLLNASNNLLALYNHDQGNARLYNATRLLVSCCGLAQAMNKKEVAEIKTEPAQTCLGILESLMSGCMATQKLFDTKYTACMSGALCSSAMLRQGMFAPNKNGKKVWQALSLAAGLSSIREWYHAYSANNNKPQQQAAQIPVPSRERKSATPERSELVGATPMPGLPQPPNTPCTPNWSPIAHETPPVTPPNQIRGGRVPAAEERAQYLRPHVELSRVGSPSSETPIAPADVPPAACTPRPTNGPRMTSQPPRKTVERNQQRGDERRAERADNETAIAQNRERDAEQRRHQAASVRKSAKPSRR